MPLDSLMKSPIHPDRIVSQLVRQSPIQNYPKPWIIITTLKIDQMGTTPSAGNSAGFSSQLNSGCLPSSHHITYDGVFNELTFKVGPRAKELLEVYTGICRSAFDKSCFDTEVSDYLALFLKSNRDGQPRGPKRLNAVIVVDVSGSMGCPLSRTDPMSSRLSLCKEAINMFVSKLREDDSFGLVTFTQTATTLIPCQRKGNLDLNGVFAVVNSMKAQGGTTLDSGFTEASINLKSFLDKNTKGQDCENRIVMLTDVNDNFGPFGPILKSISNSSINTTIIGISEEFQSSTCDALKQVPGFNYFCAVEIKDLKKYLFENFDYTFFPCLNNLEIRLETNNIIKLDVFGTPDSQTLYTKNNYAVKGNCNYLITQIPSIFPSELETVEGEVLTHGGLILVKILPRKQSDRFQGKLHVKYQTLEGVTESITVELDFQLPLNQQFYSESSLEDAIRGFYFVSEMKETLRYINDSKEHNQRGPVSLSKYIMCLNSLEGLAPESKAKEVNMMAQILRSKAALGHTAEA